MHDIAKDILGILGDNARCVVKYNKESVTGFCASGITEENTETDNGFYQAVSGVIRYPKSDEPVSWASTIIGKKIEMNYQNNFFILRVYSRTEAAGSVRLNVVSDNE